MIECRFSKNRHELSITIKKYCAKKSSFLFCNDSSHETVHSKIDQVVFSEMILTRLKNLSIVMKIAFIPNSVMGKATMKSIEMM